MLGQNLLSVVKKYAYPFCDWCDVLNSRVAAIVIAVCCLIVTGKQVFGDVIRCIPVNQAAISNYIVSYAEVSCWANYTVHIPLEDHFNDSHHYKISYYQWAHYFLAAQALAFFLPSLVWYYMAESHFPFASTVRKSSDDEIAVNLEKRQKLIKAICRSLHWYFQQRRKKFLPKMHDSLPKKTWVRFATYQVKQFFLSFAPSGCRLIWCYLFVKVLFLANLASQFYMMQSFIGNRFSHVYGFSWVMQRLCNTKWEPNLLPFPLQTLCVVQVKTHEVENKLFQCFLTLNLLYNRMFTYISFLLAIMTVATLCNFICWIIWMILMPARYCYVRSLLVEHRDRHSFVENHPNFCSINGQSSSLFKDSVHIFVHKYLQQDGVLIIKLLTSATSSFFGFEVCNALFLHFVSIAQSGSERSMSCENNVEVDSLPLHFANDGFEVGNGCENERDKKHWAFVESAMKEEIVLDEKPTRDNRLHRWFEHATNEKKTLALEHFSTSGTFENPISSDEVSKTCRRDSSCGGDLSYRSHLLSNTKCPSDSCSEPVHSSESCIGEPMPLKLSQNIRHSHRIVSPPPEDRKRLTFSEKIVEKGNDSKPTGRPKVPVPLLKLERRRHEYVDDDSTIVGAGDSSAYSRRSFGSST